MYAVHGPVKEDCECSEKQLLYHSDCWFYGQRRDESDDPRGE